MDLTKEWTDVLLIAGLILAVVLLRLVFSKSVMPMLVKFSAKTEAKWIEQAALAYEKPIRFLIVAAGIYAVYVYLPFNPAYDAVAVKLFRTSVIVVVSWGLFNFASETSALFHKLGEKMDVKFDQIVLPFLSRLVRFTIAALALSVIAQEWGYDVNGFVAGLGLGGLAVALAAKDTVANFFGGVIIVTEKPFSIGDWIHTPSVEGIVEDISFRSTKIRTFAQALITVPNATLANEPITNWSRMGKRRITFRLTIPYSTPREKIVKVVREIEHMLKTNPEIHQEMIFVRFDEYGENGFQLFLYFFTVTIVWGEYLRVKEDCNLKILEILEREGVSVALPAQNVYVRQSKHDFAADAE